MTDIELGKAESPPGSSEPNYVLWYVETEFSDIRGVRYTVRTNKAFGSGTAPRRVRRWKVDVWRPQKSDHLRSIWWIDFRDWLARKLARGRGPDGIEPSGARSVEPAQPRELRDGRYRLSGRATVRMKSLKRWLAGDQVGQRQRRRSERRIRPEWKSGSGDVLEVN